MSAWDMKTMQAMLAGPGIDTRTWISYGTVTKETDSGIKAVQFDDDYSQVLVAVTLQPNDTEVLCRVATGVAGNGEGEYFPFIQGDEVIVAVPMGDEKSGPVIIGRLNNASDKFPTRVAGNEVNENKMAFLRMRTPMVIETGSSYLIQSSVTGAAIGIDQTGGIVVSGGDKAFLAIKPDFLGLQNKAGDVLMQIGTSGDGSTDYVAIEAKGVKLRFNSDTSTPSSILTPGILGIGTSGSSPRGHGVTVEQVIALINASWVTYGGLNPGPATGATMAAAFADPSGPALVGPTSYILLASTTPMVGSLASLQVALSKPPNPDPSIVGAGIAGFLLG